MKFKCRKCGWTTETRGMPLYVVSCPNTLFNFMLPFGHIVEVVQ